MSAKPSTALLAFFVLLGPACGGDVTVLDGGEGGASDGDSTGKGPNNVSAGAGAASNGVGGAPNGSGPNGSGPNGSGPNGSGPNGSAEAAGKALPPVAAGAASKCALTSEQPAVRVWQRPVRAIGAPAPRPSTAPSCSAAPTIATATPTAISNVSRTIRAASRPPSWCRAVQEALAPAAARRAASRSSHAPSACFKAATTR